MRESFWALGLMSGTSLDGIDAALIRTDGNHIHATGEALTIPYSDALRHQIREVIYQRGDVAATEQELTLAHSDAVKTLLAKAKMTPKDIKVIGFHGQTISHRPNEHITWQLGNGQLLAEKTRIDVVYDFRRRDMAAGGHGAPLVPLFHAALVSHMELPVAILNIGGIANVTWVGRSEATDDDIMALDIIAFDVGPGNVLLNEWVWQQIGKTHDENGLIAAAGQAKPELIQHYLADAFFHHIPPKSLDRNYFSLERIHTLSLEDGAATLVHFTAEAIKKAEMHFPVKPKHWYVAGGGRHNHTLMQELAKRLPLLKSVETLGWNGDALEAQAFAYLAVRSLKKLPLTLPTTTGVSRPVTGGVYCAAATVS